jgi:hypothetical protein
VEEANNVNKDFGLLFGPGPGPKIKMKVLFLEASHRQTMRGKTCRLIVPLLLLALIPLAVSAQKAPGAATMSST